jgi:hypothetical protein
MADFTGSIDERMSPNYLAYYDSSRQHINLVVHGAQAGQVLLYPLEGNWVHEYPPVPARQNSYDAGHVLELGEFWFEIIHVFPRAIDVGILVTTVIYYIDIFNAYQYQNQDFQSFGNNVDTGFQILNLPTLPHTLEPLSGIQLILEASPDGPPTISGEFTFGFVPYDIDVPVTGIRVVLFTFRPEEPMKEGMEFMTDIMETLDGTEQRIALRKNPRQTYDTQYMKWNPERQAIENMIFDWQGRIFGMPVWYELMTLTSSASEDDLVINVNTTAYRDLRVGSLVVIRKNFQEFDALEIESFTATSITFISGLTHDYAAGAEVYPVRKAYIDNQVRGSKSILDAELYNIRWRVIDNDSDLADSSAFPTKDGKVLLDGYNYVEQKMGESFYHDMRELDGEVGLFSLSSLWEKHQRNMTFTFVTNGWQELWEVRQLLHYLKGQQRSFYITTSYFEITPIATMTSGNTAITIKNIGYTRFARLRWPKYDIRVILTDGTILVREIASSSEISETVEQLAVDISWPYDIEPEEVQRIEFIELVRLREDEVEIIHENGYGEARIELPVKGVFDEL